MGVGVGLGVSLGLGFELADPGLRPRPSLAKAAARCLQLCLQLVYLPPHLAHLELMRLGELRHRA